jgi:3-phosphoshikimate 1-carboxyvinyltransferase
VAGDVRLPGSKSLSNRVLLLAALAEGTTRVHNLLDSEDIRYMVAALQALGVGVEVDWATGDARVVGVGGEFPAPGAALFLGNAGTAMRPLTAAVAAAGRGEFVLDGVARMRERPIADLVAGLKQLGVDAECTAGTGCPPVRVRAAGMAPGRVRGGRGGNKGSRPGSRPGSGRGALTAPPPPPPQVDLAGTVSSQYLTALLMAAPLARAELAADGATATDIVVAGGALISQPYVDMTVKLMARFGGAVERVEGLTHLRVPAGQTYRSPGDAHVEGDASSASYFLAGAALTGGTITVHGCGTESLQGDVAFASVLERMGATLAWAPTSVTLTGPPRGTLVGVDADCADIPDAAMTLAVVALFARGPTTIRNVGSWRVKETERMAAIVAECTKLGAAVEEGSDYCVITPPARGVVNENVEIETYDDHRMAMAFALVAAGGAAVTILDPGCTRKTFPTYFEALAAVSSRA